MAESLSVGLMAAGTLAQTVGTIAAGRSQGAALDFEAAQFDRNAKAETARASRLAAEEHRQKRLALSRAQLVGAASGGGRAWDVEGDLEAEGQYRALTALWDGDERATGRRMQAAGRRFEARTARRAGFIAGAGTLAHGASTLIRSDALRTMREKYG